MSDEFEDYLLLNEPQDARNKRMKTTQPPSKAALALTFTKPCVVDGPGGDQIPTYTVWLKAGNQSFCLTGDYATSEEAEWMRFRLAEAIDTSMAPLREAAEQFLICFDATLRDRPLLNQEADEKMHGTNNGIWRALDRFRTALSGSGVVTPKDDGLREAAFRVLAGLQVLDINDFYLEERHDLRTALESSQEKKA